MKSIIYKFNDGSKSVVEVTDEFYETYMEFERIDRNKDRSETRHKVSLESLESKGFEAESTEPDPLEKIIKVIDSSTIKKAIQTLSPEQKRIIYEIYFLKERQTKIADKMRVSEGKVRKTKNAAIKKMKKFFKKWYEFSIFVAYK